MNYLLSITVFCGITSIVLCLDSKDPKEPYGPEWEPEGEPNWKPEGEPEWGPNGGPYGEPNWNPNYGHLKPDYSGYPSYKPKPIEPLDAICILIGKNGTVKFTQYVSRFHNFTNKNVSVIESVLI